MRGRGRWPPGYQSSSGVVGVRSRKVGVSFVDRYFVFVERGRAPVVAVVGEGMVRESRRTCWGEIARKNLVCWVDIFPEVVCRCPQVY